MSSLWTPGGEHQIPRRGEPGAEPPPPPQPEPGEPSGPRYADELDPEVLEELRRAQQEILETPIDQLVAQHAVGLHQLAALHLAQQPPSLESARLAIDAMGALVEGLSGRLGEAEATLGDALAQLRLLFVQLSRDAGAAPDADG